MSKEEPVSSNAESKSDFVLPVCIAAYLLTFFRSACEKLHSSSDTMHKLVTSFAQLQNGDVLLFILNIHVISTKLTI